MGRGGRAALEAPREARSSGPTDGVIWGDGGGGGGSVPHPSEPRTEPRRQPGARGDPDPMGRWVAVPPDPIGRPTVRPIQRRGAAIRKRPRNLKVRTGKERAETRRGGGPTETGRVGRCGADGGGKGVPVGGEGLRDVRCGAERRHRGLSATLWGCALSYGAEHRHRGLSIALWG